MTDTPDEIPVQVPELKTVHDCLYHIQQKLVAPKNQYSSFGKYHYRSAEDILEAVKKIMPTGATLVLHDDLIEMAGQIYIRATATLTYNGAQVQAWAYAREVWEKKGFDGSQLTGAASTYARKYALQGLLLIDDAKDADAQRDMVEEKQQEVPAQQSPQQPVKKSPLQIRADEIRDAMKNAKSVKMIDQIWNLNVTDLNKIKEVSPIGYETLDKAYLKLRDDLVKLEAQEDQIPNFDPPVA